MNKIKIGASLAACAVLAAGLTACGGDSDSGATSSSTAVKNAANTAIINPSDKTGGDLRYAMSSDWDSPDPGDTYYAFSWNFARYYARTLVTFKNAPGAEGQELVPDLAEDLGKASNNNKTWTYKLRKGLKYDDGTEITAQDIKYAVERSNFTDELQGGPKYFKQYLVDNASPYKGPYKDKSADGLKSIETPDKYTIKFNLNTPFAEFDYLAFMPQTAPVPQAKDNGLNYKKNIVSSGPYKIDSYEVGKAMKLSRNTNWDQSTDEVRKALPDTISVALNQNQDDIDNKLMSGALDMDLAAGGLGTAAQPKALGGTEVGNTDAASGSALTYMTIDSRVAPFDNIACRRAVQYALDKDSVQTSLGGPITGGDIATTVLPPTVVGHEDFDKYPTADNKGDVTKAKAQLAECGQANGFTAKLTYRADRPKEVSAAESIQQSLGKAGIKVELKGYPSGDYFTKYAGSPAFLKDNGVGMAMMKWAADWPSGFGFLQQILDGRSIKPTGNTNLSSTDLPKINKLFDRSTKESDADARSKIYGQIDQLSMDNADIVPLTYSVQLLYRPENLTNVVVSEFMGGQYDYVNLGLK
ncbi:peptide/nickel transport system substrate-binding protein [Actinocorallia herbida]|uniref:Peptide/nickel transport system substrate-binding protein n=1 Tax=Actinocorallia herbida TaxID=58109 RepID=A0A3N1D5U4_9ACTN|nr:ABC transporter substrate-binding protein [Actinocorallia herbida]ROO88458.1 peptide/nickel transport system substrate-binding protein [Actinocorallia herbida]